jgi:hypothetical protein
MPQTQQTIKMAYETFASSRQERVLTDADGKETRILFTMRALGEAEKVVGKPIMGILDDLVQNRGSIDDIAGLLRAGMEAARRDAKQPGRVVSMADAYDVMEACGFAQTTATVGEAIAGVISYTPESPN